jgi:RecA-family ATPase
MSDQQQTNLDYALRYAAIGWKVLPLWSVNPAGQCRCGSDHTNEEGKPQSHKFGKHPHGGVGGLAPNGFLDATDNPVIIRRWFASDPDAGIGVACAASGLVVLDIDPRNDGDLTLARLEAEHGVIHSDVTAKTQGGGEHRVFKAEQVCTYPITLGKGLDIKHNGYICVQPTIGGQGIYRWEDEANPLHGCKPSPHPALLTGKAKSDYKLTEQQGKPVATAQTFEDLAVALTYLDANHYDDWTKLGLALKPYGEPGYALWAKWSSTSAKFNATEARRKWDRDLVEPESLTYLSIFRAAMDAGWVNGRSNQGAADARTTWQEFDLGDLELEPVDYLIDDFLARSLMVFVGKPGMGKSTAMIALAAIVAGFKLPDSPLTAPVVGRKIIYITEDTDQLKRNINALNRNFGFSKTEMKSAFIVLSARRVVAKELRQLRTFVERHTVTHECGVVLKPWVIFDTTSASFHLEDENSNAEVAAVLALLKAEFYEDMQCSVCMVAHSHKHTTRKDFVADPRGAGAWAGDTTLTSGIFEEGDQRYIMLGKRRYSPRNSTVRVELRTQQGTTTDQYGRSQSVELDSTWFDWSSEAVRKQSHGKDIGIANTYLDDNVLKFLVLEKLAGRTYSQNKLGAHKSNIDGCPSRDRIRDAVSRLKNNGDILHKNGRSGVTEGWEFEPTAAGIERVNRTSLLTVSSSSKFGIAPERAL